MTCKFETQHTRPYSNHEERFFNPARIFRALPALAFIVIAGCAGPPLNFNVPNLEISERRIDAEVGSIIVTIADDDEQVGSMDLHIAEESIFVPAGDAVRAAWRTALIETLNRSLVFSNGAAQKVTVVVTILKLEIPIVGLSFTTDTVARYEIVDHKNAEVIFSEEIAASGTTEFGYSWYGPDRGRESISRAVGNNIAGFLQAMQASNLASQ